MSRFILVHKYSGLSLVVLIVRLIRPKKYMTLIQTVSLPVTQTQFQHQTSVPSLEAVKGQSGTNKETDWCRKQWTSIRVVSPLSRMDCSSRKPALVQDTDYMVEKTYHLAPYFGALGAYLMPPWPIQSSTGISIHQNDRWTWPSTHVIFHLVKKDISIGQATPTDNMDEQTYHLTPSWSFFRPI